MFMILFKVLEKREYLKFFLYVFLHQCIYCKILFYCNITSLWDLASILLNIT